ncbi:TonB-dependent receptor [Asticcacaulis solisilvae]|uniref:TonB-dependent receptor n=1 Tax=Asticcacaulis solisilvae TaxID=1217274 RepID=UPI003FD8AF26
MTPVSKHLSRIRRPYAALRTTTSLMLLALMAAAPAMAQTSAAQTAQSADAAAKPKADDSVVVVTGVRASQQGSINRKKRAKTVSDSVVADDVSQFPDKNVGEALGRITGVQLSRDMGEGTGVSIRGAEPDLNNVEIDGMSALSTAGNIQVYGGGGRANDFRELASELVKSIDVFKGFTADMTEGGVGGTVSVTTNRPLDFKKPVVSITASAQNLDTVKGWKPRYNLFVADQFLDHRLGVMANVTFDDVDTRGDYARNTGWGRFADFDGSADKTANYYNSGYSSAINKALDAVNTYSACASLTSPDTTQISTSNYRTACQSQWYDYAPRVARYGVWTRNDKRLSAEFTLQYKVSDKLNTWLTWSRNNRSETLNDINYGTSLSSVKSLYNTNAAGTGCSSTDTTLGKSVVDANHNVISYTLGNCITTSGYGGYGMFGISSRDFQYDSHSDYVNGGADYKGDRWTINLQGSHGETETVSQTNNASVTFNTPGMTVSLNPDTGVPSFTFAQGYSPSDPSAVISWQIQYRPSEARTAEDQYKLDFTYQPDGKLITGVKFGYRGTQYTTTGYGYGGFLLDAGSNLASTTDDTVIYSNAVNSTATVVNSQAADQTDPASTVTANQTGYWTTGENWSRSFSNSVYGQAMTSLPDSFYWGGGSIPSTWLYPNYDTLSQYLDTSHFNLDNLYTTVGSDGKTYGQIPYHLAERTDAQYLRLDYAFPVNGLDVEGNFGLRRVHTHEEASGVLTRQVVRYTGDTSSTSTCLSNPSSCSTSTATATYVISNTQTAMEQDYTDYLPSFNAAVWLSPNEVVVRYGWAKLMARPLINYLVPTTTCTTYQAPDEDGVVADPTCSGGNPNLKPYRANESDLSIEYYPNRDTQLSLGFFNKDIKSFYVSTKSYVGSVDYFGDGTYYNLTTYINGQGANINGMEVTAKTAFTFLPGWLSGFGVDANYTHQIASHVGLYSALDGSELPFPGLSSDSYNFTLWYQKYGISTRLAYNYRSRYLSVANDSYGEPVYHDPTGYLDGRFAWSPASPRGVTYFVEGKNLTNQAERYTAGDIRLTENGYYGRRFFVGVTIKR